MTLLQAFGIGLGFKVAIALGLVLSMAAVLLVTPKAMKKLVGAGITGRDRHKEGSPEIPEMGGLAVFVAFNVGTFAILAFGGIAREEQTLVLASLVVAAGACITGVIDDLVALRQRFKAFIPLAFAIPLALYAPDPGIWFPFIGRVEMGLLYSLLLVPLAVACASNGFNMLEGFNGIGTGVGIVLASALSVMAILNGQFIGLAILFPLIGALGGFLYFNAYPARIFPGDTMTLFVGAMLASAAILSKIEFWGALLFVPHVLEFFLKARGSFRVQSFASRVDEGILRYQGPTRSLTHVIMRRRALTEPQLVGWILALETAVAVLVIGVFVATRMGPV